MPPELSVVDIAQAISARLPLGARFIGFTLGAAGVAAGSNTPEAVSPLSGSPTV